MLQNMNDLSMGNADPAFIEALRLQGIEIIIAK